jgi:hypothetical protein
VDAAPEWKQLGRRLQSALEGNVRGGSLELFLEILFHRFARCFSRGAPAEIQSPALQMRWPVLAPAKSEFNSFGDKERRNQNQNPQ